MNAAAERRRPAAITMPRSRRITFFLALASAAFFFWHTVRPAWSKPSSDFPNYYTAALLLRQHKPLESFYDWPSFQREIAEAGFGAQLGGYVPQTPLAMLPFVPLMLLEPQTARRAWVLVNLTLLAVTLILITRMTRFRLSAVWLIALLSYPAMRSNFILGQYYIFLLALITLAAYSLFRGWHRGAGVFSASAAVLKMYGLPLVVFFALSNRKRAAAWMVFAVLASVAGAVMMFGRHGLEYYGSIILPRALSGETLDPYNPGNNSAATLLRRIFIAEPELNPHPLLDSPRVFTFLWSAFVLLVLTFPMLASASERNKERGRMKVLFAWWLIAILLASPNTASYTFALLLLPTALLLNALPLRRALALAAANLLIALPAWAPWRMAFPRVWLLILAFIVAGWDEISAIPKPHAAIAIMAVFAVSFGAATWRTDASPPGAVAAFEPAAIYSGRAATFRDGIIYESIADELYELKVARGGSIATWRFPGHAFQPSAPDSGWPVYFETVGRARRIRAMGAADPGIPASTPDFTVSHDGGSVAFASGEGLYLSRGNSRRRLAAGDHGRDLSFVPGDRSIVFVAEDAGNSRIESVELNTGRVTVLVSGGEEMAHPSVSSDAGLLAYARRKPGQNWIIRLQSLAGKNRADIATPGCNCYDPAWRPNSDELVYSTDCRRGVLLPRLMVVHGGSLFNNLSK